MFSEQGLRDMQATLAADGYALAAFEEGDQVVVTIEATPEACEDCLAPPDVMSARNSIVGSMPGWRASARPASA